MAAPHLLDMVLVDLHQVQLLEEERGWEGRGGRVGRERREGGKGGGRGKGRRVGRERREERGGSEFNLSIYSLTSLVSV